MIRAELVEKSRWLPAILRVFGAWAIVAGGPSASAASAVPGSDATRADVLLVTIDTLRADALGWTGGRAVTPHIDALAASGARARDTVTPLPLTLPAHASLLTGLLPARHGSHGNGQPIAASVTSLAEWLRGAGYRTGAFVGAFPLVRDFGLDRGFDVYDDALPGDPGRETERRCGATNDAALAWVTSANRPWFAWVHYYEPHAPYEPMPGPRPERAADDYLSEVERADACLGELLAGVDSRAAGTRLAIVVGDHGESLGEHDELTHGYFVYDTTALVPLVMHWPGHVEPRALGRGSRLVDVAPTILDLLGLAPRDGIDGASLRPGLEGRGLGARMAYVETELPFRLFGWAPLRAIRGDGWKLIEAPRAELYDLAADPGERHDVLATEPERTAKLRAELARIATLPAPANPRSAALDEQAIEKLRALGYADAGSSRTVPRSTATLADPKDRLAMRSRLQEAEGHLLSNRPERALEGFDSVLTEEPNNPFALTRSALALARLGRTEESTKRLTRALDSGDDEPRIQLARVWMQANRYDDAAAQWRVVLDHSPRRVEAWAQLAVAEARQGHLEAAATALDHASEIEPTRAEHWIRLAQVEQRLGRNTAAAEHWLRAAGLGPAEQFAHAATLGTLLLQLGRRDEGRTWLEKVAPAQPGYAEAQLNLALLALDAGARDDAAQAVRRALVAAPALRDRVNADPRLAPLAP